MPNAENVDAPVTLVGPGRSGTTLVTRIFRKHSQFSAMGESANLVYGSFHQLTRQLRNTGPIPGDRSIDEAARDAVRAMLCSAYPSEQPRWFQKPIHVPTVHRDFDDPEAFDAWYWRTTDLVFPRGRFLTVVRDPADVAASSMVRWGGSEEKIFSRIRSTLRLLLHPDSRLGLALPFEWLRTDPEGAARALLDFAGAPFEERTLAAFDRQHAANPDVDRPTGLVVPRDVSTMYDELLSMAEV